MKYWNNDNEISNEKLKWNINENNNVWIIRKW